MPEMMNIIEIATRLGLNSSSVRRLIAKESEALNLTLLRGKADKLLLSKEDAERLIASYEARRGAVIILAEDPDVVKYDRYGFFYLIQLVPEGATQPCQNWFC